MRRRVLRQPDGSDDAVLSPEAFSERFEITSIIND
jgi:hypothetical protein